MFRIRLHLSYDGTNYQGWQKQTRERTEACAPVPTIQATLEAAIKKIFGVETPVIGASRTDSGVHALMQVAHFDCIKDPTKFKDLPYTLQSVLPPDIVVKAAYVAPDDFNSSWNTTSKLYRYVIYNSERPSALKWQHSLWIRRRPLDLDRLNSYSQKIRGTHDFASFRNAGGGAKTTNRQILRAEWLKQTQNLVFFEIHGRGFLKQMVRNLVGTMLDLEQDRANAEEFQRILDSKAREAALTTAPPHGLYLMRIFYPEDLDNKCRKL